MGKFLKSVVFHTQFIRLLLVTMLFGYKSRDVAMEHQVTPHHVMESFMSSGRFLGNCHFLMKQGKEVWRKLFWYKQQQPRQQLALFACMFISPTCSVAKAFFKLKK